MHPGAVSRPPSPRAPTRPAPAQTDAIFATCVVAKKGGAAAPRGKKPPTETQALACVPKPGDKIIVVGGRRPGLERKKHADLHRRVGAAAAVGVVAGPATATVGGDC